MVNLYSQAADGTGTAERLTTSANPQYPTSITPDGTLLAFDTVSSAARILLFRLASPASRPAPDPRRCESVAGGAVSSRPCSTEGGRSSRPTAATSRTSRRVRAHEIYVRPFPQVDSGRWQISTAGGTRPAWARNGRELFYLDASNTLTAVPVQTSGSTFSAGKPAKVFDAKYADAISPAPLRRVAGRPAVPDAQRQPGRRSECDAGQHGRRPQLVRGAETACDDERKVKPPVPGCIWAPIV